MLQLFQKYVLIFSLWNFLYKGCNGCYSFSRNSLNFFFTLELHSVRGVTGVTAFPEIGLIFFTLGSFIRGVTGVTAFPEICLDFFTPELHFIRGVTGVTDFPEICLHFFTWELLFRKGVTGVTAFPEICLVDFFVKT